MFAGSLFPFLFITIACGASGFHSPISSGTTPKLLENEKPDADDRLRRHVDKSFVAIMALITASILNQHLYFVMNARRPYGGAAASDGRRTPMAWGCRAPDHPLSRSPRPPTPSASIPSCPAPAVRPLWPSEWPRFCIRRSAVPASRRSGTHFAIMFEALFILTTVDAGTRVARFMLSDGLGNLGGAPLKKLRDPSWRVGAWVCSLIVVAAWGSILLMGVTDPLGGINTLFPCSASPTSCWPRSLTVVTVVVVRRACCAGREFRRRRCCGI